MMDYTKAPADHDQTKCFILVDKGVAEIVQTILDFFNHRVIPHACCEGGGAEKAYISVVVRSMPCFEHMLLDLFEVDREIGINRFDFFCIKKYIIIAGEPSGSVRMLKRTYWFEKALEIAFMIKEHGTPKLIYD